MVLSCYNPRPVRGRKYSVSFSSHFLVLLQSTPRQGTEISKKPSEGKNKPVTIHAPSGDGNSNITVILDDLDRLQSTPRQGTEITFELIGISEVGGYNPRPVRGRKLTLISLRTRIDLVTIHAPSGDGNVLHQFGQRILAGYNPRPVRGRKYIAAV